ncbi:MAG TPA: pyridoxamine 5'-phosphate oxidase [Acidimicrobiales bacterium]|nr:pyridoxamine 5'-phosphate oxidase [Acidimicrobiales bacterium]
MSPPAEDPISKFQQWLADATAFGVHEPTAMTVATAGADGAPAARMVLLKGVDERGFTFFTNYDSDKGAQLRENPRAALVFPWHVMGRQVRVTGPVERVSGEESDEYFASRPPPSRISAWASPQSGVIAGRDVLERKVAELSARWPGDGVPRPPFWGGFRVRPLTIEFWTHKDDRLHDRERYTRENEGWRVECLAP